MSVPISKKQCGCPCSCNGNVINGNQRREDQFFQPLQGCLKLMEYENVATAANFLLNQTRYRPKIAVICGSGLGSLGDVVKEVEEFPYEIIPNFPVSTAPGHKSRILFGTLNGVEVMLMQGRFHLYEAYPINLCCMPVRVMKLVGIKVLVATNAAGGLNQNLERGDIMIINDHVNFPGFSGINPLCGPNDERFGPRFFPLDDLYDVDLRELGFEVAKDLNMSGFVKEGSYVIIGGPNFETPSELRLMRALGIDAVGMSTVHEAITAKHCGMDVFAFSLITNVAITEIKKVKRTKEEADEFATEVQDTAKYREKDLQQFVTKLVEKIYRTLL